MKPDVTINSLEDAQKLRHDRLPVDEGKLSWRECDTVTKFLAYLQHAKDMGHETIGCDDPKLRRLGFVDHTIGVWFWMAITTVHKATKEERKAIDWKTGSGRDEAFGTLGDVLGFEADPDMPDLPSREDFDNVEDFLAARQAYDEKVFPDGLWATEGEAERVEVENVDEQLAPHPSDGQGGIIKREKFHYLQSTAESLGEDSESKVRNVDPDQLAQNLREAQDWRILSLGARLYIMSPQGGVKDYSGKPVTTGISQEVTVDLDIAQKLVASLDTSQVVVKAVKPTKPNQVPSILITPIWAPKEEDDD